MTDIPIGYASVRELLVATMDGFSNGERKVARALIAQYPTAGLTTIAELAGAAGVSPPTVVRFVNRLGLSGFPELQRMLIRELNDQLGSPLMQYPRKRSLAEHNLLPRTRDAFAEILATSYANLPASEFNKLVHLLADHRRDVHLAGGRFSRMVANYLAAHLKLLRPNVYSLGLDEIDRRAVTADVGPESVLLVYDYRRYTHDNLVLAKELGDRGTTVCLMTDNWLSPIAKIASVVLPCRVESASPFDSLVASMAITESIVAAVADSLGREGMERIERLEPTPD